MVARFMPALAEGEDGHGADWRFPRHFEPADADPNNPAFPFRRNDRRVAVVHADLSGLGQFFRTTAIETIENAARRARRTVLLPTAARLDATSTKADVDAFRALFGPTANTGDLAAVRLLPARPLERRSAR
jgi:hypothetical protein